MREESELMQQLAALILESRRRSGLSIGAVAERINRDDKTVSNWERGKTAPSVPELIRCFDAMGQPLLRPVLELVYPDIFKGADADPAAARAALLAYISNVATDDEVSGLAFLIFGPHGSNWQSQLQEFVALDHLPMAARLQAAQGIYDNYIIGEETGTLSSVDQVPPDLGLLHDGIEKGREAARSGKGGYTTAGVKHG